MYFTLTYIYIPYIYILACMLFTGPMDESGRTWLSRVSQNLTPQTSKICTSQTFGYASELGTLQILKLLLVSWCQLKVVFCQVIRLVFRSFLGSLQFPKRNSQLEEPQTSADLAENRMWDFPWTQRCPCNPRCGCSHQQSLEKRAHMSSRLLKNVRIIVKSRENERIEQDQSPNQSCLCWDSSWYYDRYWQMIEVDSVFYFLFFLECCTTAAWLLNVWRLVSRMLLGHPLGQTCQCCGVPKCQSRIQQRMGSWRSSKKQRSWDQRICS